MSVTGTLTGLGVDPLGGALDDAVGGTARSVADAGLTAISAWVLGGTRAALDEVAHIIGTSTAPNLESAWFSGTYWRVAAIASLLTLPFLFAAAVQALLRSDLALLARAAFVQLPLALVGVSVTAPLVMLLLAATDEMSAIVAGSGVGGGAQFLDKAAATVGAISTLDGSPFFAFLVALLTVTAAIGLTLELLVREAAVYVVVLMLPIAFAGLVWPARRIWAARLLELLVGLILSKFVIVSVLSLAGSALGAARGVPQLLTAMSLLVLSCFAPWALVRIIPFTEVAAHASDGLRQPINNAEGHIRSLASGGGGTGPARSLAGSENDGRGAETDDESLVRFRGRALPEQAGGPGSRLGDGHSGGGRVSGEPGGGGPSGSGPGGDGPIGGGRAGVGGPRPSGGVDRGTADASVQSPGPPARMPQRKEAFWQADNETWPELQLGFGRGGGPREYVDPHQQMPTPEPPPTPERLPPPADPLDGSRDEEGPA